MCAGIYLPAGECMLGSFWFMLGCALEASMHLSTSTVWLLKLRNALVDCVVICAAHSAVQRKRTDGMQSR
jgi:hypothetical protein